VALSLFGSRPRPERSGDIGLKPRAAVQAAERYVGQAWPDRGRRRPCRVCRFAVQRLYPETVFEPAVRTMLVPVRRLPQSAGSRCGILNCWPGRRNHPAGTRRPGVYVHV